MAGTRDGNVAACGDRVPQQFRHAAVRCGRVPAANDRRRGRNPAAIIERRRIGEVRQEAFCRLGGLAQKAVPSRIVWKLPGGSSPAW